MSVEQHNHYQFPLMLSLSHFPFRNICLIINVFLYFPEARFYPWESEMMINWYTFLYGLPLFFHYLLTNISIVAPLRTPEPSQPSPSSFVSLPPHRVHPDHSQQKS